MVNRCSTFGRMAKDAEIKFRCEEDLRARFERIASLERRAASDLGRIVFEDYIATRERELGLVGGSAPVSLNETTTKYKVSPDGRDENERVKDVPRQMEPNQHNRDEAMPAPKSARHGPNAVSSAESAAYRAVHRLASPAKRKSRKDRP
jgi:hypothetical protein